ncbi:MAG: type III-B CRISPR module RAMP protein Cmr1 [bacterium]|nr:type III-B CRISPR module RAMP protein Cmr1 [bacterium]
MKELNLRCKLITPMFMAGSDKETTELRPTEFKGMIRWWWRAIKAEDNIQKLKKEEAEIFGSIEKEGKSKLYIRILTELNESDKIDYQRNWRELKLLIS